MTESILISNSYFLFPFILDFDPMINKSIRGLIGVANNRPSLIDNIFINTIDKKIDTGNIIDQVSDHMFNFVLVKDIIEAEKYQKIKIRDMKSFNRNK